MEIKITATTVEKFQELQQILDELPLTFQYQIESIAHEGLMGVTLYFRTKFDNKNEFYIPSSTTTIKDYGSYIGVHTPKFFIKIPVLEGEKNKHFTYNFIEI